MSRCPYCRRELPGFETLCQKCFEAGYDRIAHPTPWWQRMRFAQDCVHVFLFVFVYAYLILSINRDSHPTMVGRVLLGLILAAGVILVGIALGEARKPKVTLRGLYAFVFLFLYFFLRLWAYSSYHPFPNPALWAFVGAAIAAIAESFRADSDRRTGTQKKTPGDLPAPTRNDSRDAVKREGKICNLKSQI